VNNRGVLSGTDVENIRNMFVDADTGGDVLFWLYATCIYAVVRVAVELLFPGKVRGYTVQQYTLSFFHQAIVLPGLSICWLLDLMPDAATLVYLMTGAYLASDSFINYTPVSGCVAGATGAGASFSWGVHAHHLITVLLCALGTALPPWPVKEGAMCILLGEAGSLWISVTLLRPTPLNFAIRFYTFVISRALGFLIALDIARQLESPLRRWVFISLAFCMIWDNWRTMNAMRKNMPNCQNEDVDALRQKTS